jgi:transcriptional regulator with XRE-family HTH domain
MLTQLTSQQKNRIWIFREAAGLSRTELSQRSGVVLSTLYMTKDGLLDTKVSTLLKLANALEVTPNALLGFGRSAERS